MKAGKLAGGKVVHALIGGYGDSEEFVTVCDKKVRCEPDGTIPFAAVNCKKCLEYAAVKNFLAKTAPEQEAKKSTLPASNTEHSEAEKAVAVSHEEQEAASEDAVSTDELKKDKALAESVKKLAKKFNLKTADEIKFVISLIEKAPPKETDSELRLRISDSVKDFRARQLKDPWPNKAAGKKAGDGDMGALNDLTPKERRLITSGKRTIDEVMAARKYAKDKKADKKRLRAKVKESKKLRKKEEREGKRRKKKRMKKVRKNRNEFGNKVGSLFDILDQLFLKGSTLEEMVEGVKKSGLYKGKKPAGKVKSHVRKFTRRKGYAVMQIHSIKEKGTPKAKRDLGDFFKVIIPEEVKGGSDGEKV